MSQKAASARIERSYGAKQKKARTPLGRFVSGFLQESRDNRELATELLGAERTDALLRQLARVRVRRVAGAKLHATKHDVHLDDNAAHIGRFLAWLCIVFEQIHPDSRRACGRKLYQGKTRRWCKEQQRVVYVPAKEAGGVAVRLGLSPREVQRYAAIARHLGILNTWQVKHAESVQALPRVMRGKRWSYGILEWCGDLPRAVVDHVRSWWGQKEPPGPSLAAAAAPPGAQAAIRSGSAPTGRLAAVLLLPPHLQ